MSPDIALTLPGRRGRNPFRVSQYDPERDSGDWEIALNGADNSTIFHTQAFLDYHPPNRFDNYHLIFRVGEDPRCILTGAVREIEGKRALVSYPGASYGGLVYAPGLSFSTAGHLVDTLIKYVKNAGFETLIITPPPAIYSTWPADVITFQMLKSGFQYQKREITQAIPLYYPDGDVFRTLCNKTRTAVRKALKSHLRFDEDVALSDENLKTFYPLLVDNRKRLGVIPTHSLDELKTLRDLVGNRLSLSLVYHENVPVAGILNFTCNARVLLIFYVCHDWDYQELRPVPLIIYQTMQWAFRRGFRYLDFGTSTLDMDPNWGLIKFKENFGSLGYFRDTLELQL
ncbi:GNAT family N-acetyltransferase [candidate division LCP-89 bacterium B3_LCP]|uniref:GNAT family N-acetyltransferase n=1 Tax=candidate division LCP-89 bacterium B3_LCP TaxID=2012998 RepID=A0A532UVW9_UNCL8|nr:MAG: GNAT family N-acetyltransferase [candidate division LCP-89 bacterium B3_LCP]